MTDKIIEPLVFAVTAPEVNDIFQWASAQTSVDFTPTHNLQGKPFQLEDFIGSWDVVSTDPTVAVTTFSNFGAKAGRVVRCADTTKDSPQSFASTNAAHWDFKDKSWAMGAVIKLASVANGSYALSNLKGPNNPYSGFLGFGQDKGFGLSFNGDGGAGVSIYGTSGYVNCDTSNISVADNKWRVYLFGYSQNNEIGYLSCKDFHIAQNTAVGNISNTDGKFGFRANYWGQNLSGATMSVAKLIVWDEAAAENIFTYRLDMLPALQLGLE